MVEKDTMVLAWSFALCPQLEIWPKNILVTRTHAKIRAQPEVVRSAKSMENKEECRVLKAFWGTHCIREMATI